MEEQKPSGDGFPPGCGGDVTVRNSGNRDEPPVIEEEQKLPDSRTNGPVTRNRRSKVAHPPKDEMTIESSTDALNLEEKENDELTNSDNSPHAEEHPGKVQENEVENLGSKRKQQGIKEPNSKKRPNLPRRASKRIAGIEVGPLPELKPTNRSRRVSARRLNKEEAGNLAEFSEKTAATKNKTSEPPQNKSFISSEGDVNEKPGSPLNISFKDLWTDPCIEFAIKTLTGVIPIDEEDNIVTEDVAVKVKKVEDNPPEYSTQSPVEFSFKDVWEDPCIEFAIKTLTGAIPVVDDFAEQQNLPSSEMLGNNSSNVSAVTNGNLRDSGQFDLLQRQGEADMGKEVQRRTTCR